MTDLNACKAHMQTLGLKFPFIAKEEQQRFEDLVEAHHPDFCEEDDVCRETNKPLMEKIAEAHLYLREHGEECHLIERATLLEKAIQCYKEEMDSTFDENRVLDNEALGDYMIEFYKEACL